MRDLPDKRYFRPDEVATILERPVRTIYFWLAENKIKHLHFGRRQVVPREEIERLEREGV